MSIKALQRPGLCPAAERQFVRRIKRKDDHHETNHESRQLVHEMVHAGTRVEV